MACSWQPAAGIVSHSWLVTAACSASNLFWFNHSLGPCAESQLGLERQDQCTCCHASAEAQSGDADCADHVWRLLADNEVCSLGPSIACRFRPPCIFSNSIKMPSCRRANLFSQRGWLCRVLPGCWQLNEELDPRPIDSRSFGPLAAEQHRWAHHLPCQLADMTTSLCRTAHWALDATDQLADCADHAWVLADNEELDPQPIDSRSFGPLPLSNIIGRIIYHASSQADHKPVQNSTEATQGDLVVLNTELDVMELAGYEPEDKP